MKSQEELCTFARENFVPIIREKSRQFLQEVLRQKKPKKVLEIGTAIGYSGLMICQACDCHLTTVELDKTRFEIAKETFAQNNLSGRVTMILGDAKEVMLALAEQGESFDFVFLDGPKGQYCAYLPLCKALLSQGGVIFADNVNHDGLVLSDKPVEHKHRTMIVNLRKFVDEVNKDDQLESKFFDIDDGIMLIRLKKNCVTAKI